MTIRTTQISAAKIAIAPPRAAQMTGAVTSIVRLSLAAYPNAF